MIKVLRRDLLAKKFRVGKNRYFGLIKPAFRELASEKNLQNKTFQVTVRSITCKYVTDKQNVILSLNSMLLISILY